ncbi:MAG: sulfurtransferase [Campylobacterales bacterium]
MRKIVALFVFSLSLLASPAVVDVEWLEQNRENKNIVIVDLREPSEYQEGHIEGAVNIHAYKKLFGEDYMMPGLDELRETFSNAGIDSSSKVVVYDNGEFIWAARAYWLLETLGHSRVSMLNVGYGNWDKNRVKISTKPTKVEPKEFIPRVDNSKLQTKLGTLVSIGKKTIIDGRAHSHYSGEESLAKRYGHIPTAQNYACTQNYEVTKRGTKIKDFDTLKEVYKDLPKDKEIILYCDGGAEAALNYVVLQELGYNVSVYDGSWLEWGNDPAVPIENPSEN